MRDFATGSRKSAPTYRVTLLPFDGVFFNYDSGYINGVAGSDIVIEHFQYFPEN